MSLRQKLAAERKTLEEYGKRLDKIAEEHNAYYYTVIIPKFEELVSKEQTLKNKEILILQKEQELKSREDDQREYEKILNRRERQLAKKEQELNIRQQQLLKKQSDTNVKKMILPPRPSNGIRISR